MHQIEKATLRMAFSIWWAEDYPTVILSIGLYDVFYFGLGSHAPNHAPNKQDHGTGEEKHCRFFDQNFYKRER